MKLARPYRFNNTKDRESVWARRTRWTRLPNELLHYDLGLTGGEHRVLLTLLGYGDWSGSPTVALPVRSVKIADIAISLGINERTVRRAVESLHERGLLLMDRPKRRGPYQYTVQLGAVDALVAKFERTLEKRRSSGHLMQSRPDTHVRSTDPRPDTHVRTRADTHVRTTNEYTTNGKVNEPFLTNGPGEVGQTLELSSVLHPTAYIYEMSNLELSAGCKHYADAEALVVSGHDRFFVRRNSKGVPTRLADGEWKIINRYSGKCAQCGNAVPRGTGVFRDSKPLCSDCFQTEGLALGVGDWDEYAPVFYTEEEIMGDGRYLYDRVMLASEAPSRIDD